MLEPSSFLLTGEDIINSFKCKDTSSYCGELEVMEDFRTPSIVFSDLTNSGEWTCWKSGPKPAEKAKSSSILSSVLSSSHLSDSHPQLEFDRPHHRVHVHFEDRSHAGGRVLWDAEYDMGGTSTLKGAAKALSGNQQKFHKMCPPTTGPAHWYELTVTRGLPEGWPPKRPVEDFLGAQVVQTYRPDQNPDTMPWIKPGVQALGSGATKPFKEDNESSCSVM